MSLHKPFSSPDPSASLIYRQFDPECDFAELVTLLSEVEQTDHDGEDVSEAGLREQLTWPAHDPAADRWVVVQSAGTALLGHGVIFKTPNDNHADLAISVHPAWRGQGIGSELLARLLERACAMQAQDIRAYANAQHQAASGFLRRHGFEPISAYTRMKVSGTQPFPLPELPAGFVVRSYEQIQRIDLFTEAVNRSYEGLWGHRHLSQEEIELWFPQLSPGGIFLLFAPDASVIGICRAEVSEHLATLRGVSAGLVDAPGIVPIYRDAGLYAPLLLTVLQWLASQNLATIELESWGDTTATLDLYRALGFALMQEAISYRRSFL